ncbi:GNAT family N-acetyltransferase [Flavimobilis sp. GY10621]|uniref:GNAT family N-acetyltransferase n=1 Tax=Flavimobilis rhizosphaerae TaxID=2775421 RepID=A0ABR9DTJ8_9MICO|nr:GNAT family N-acetyltransferase [Flavimobilis rhizosphaerae]MBD9700460.1 GNAT family N-acetyltransferase [Flavimobilis rhizosphaerae]
MTFPAGYHHQPLDDSFREAAFTLDTWAFPSSTTPEDWTEIEFPMDWTRFVGVVADGPDPDAVPIDGAAPARSDLVAMYGSYAFDRFPVPGTEIPVGGLTWVGVHPQHRRRGILRGMITDHLDACAARGETVSALFAAEAAIYGRFGYGLAAHDVRLTIPRAARLRDVPGAGTHTVRLEIADADRHGALVESVHREAGRRPLGVDGPRGALLNRPGWAGRDDPSLARRMLLDPPVWRGGKEARRIVVVERDGEPRGFATFRRSSEWRDEGPRGTVHVGEVAALDVAAAHDLWSVLLDLDLMAKVETFLLPPDDAILGLLVDPRAAGTKRVDNVWLRLVDVAGALASRRYQADVDVVLHVTDELRPANAGSYRVRATAFAEPEVTRTHDDADLSLDVSALGAAYLGGQTLAALGLAGRVTELRSGALATASAAFGWPVAPSCSFVF